MEGTPVVDVSPRPDAGLTIRDADEADFPAVLRLNRAWEHVTSPLDLESLARLHDQAAYHRVLVSGPRVVAFLLALGPGVDYASPNYRWFEDTSTGFLYIDRVVVDAAYQRSGAGAALYDDLLAFAGRCGVRRLVCEVDVEPLNVISDAFHTRRGFVEVGTQWVAGGAKRVSLRELTLA
jgi:predicted GNAT superfamily acetyltransferase